MPTGGACIGDRFIVLNATLCQICKSNSRFLILLSIKEVYRACTCFFRVKLGMDGDLILVSDTYEEKSLTPINFECGCSGKSFHFSCQIIKVFVKRDVL